MQIIDRSSAEHYIWSNGCDGWHLVKRADMSVIVERVPPGCREIRHFHATARQFFFVLKGVATIEINGEHFVLAESQGLEVPPAIPHQFINESNEDVHFVVFSHPSASGDRSES